MLREKLNFQLNPQSSTHKMNRLPHRQGSMIGYQSLAIGYSPQAQRAVNFKTE